MIGAGLAIVLLSAPIQADENGYSPATTAYSFTVELPAGASLIHREILDFDLYQIIVDGKPVMGMYEGFTANVSAWVQDRKAVGRQERLWNEMPMEYFWNKQCDGWSNEVHAWITQDTPADAAAEARKVADSLVMKPCVNKP